MREGGIRERKMRLRTCSVLASCGKIHMPLRYKSVELDAIVTCPVFSTSNMILLRVPLPRSGIPNVVSTSDNDCWRLVLVVVSKPSSSPL